MYECLVNHPALPHLFDPAVPDHPVLWAVLEGRHAGKALVDDLASPSQCLLRTDALLTFFSRQMTQHFLDRAVAHFRQAEALWLIWPPAVKLHYPEPEAAEVIQRLAFFDLDPGCEALLELRRRLPAGFEIRPIDRGLLERCEWKLDIEFYCGSMDNFLANGMGLCLMLGDEIVVVTREAHRGQGYAPIACAYLIEACARRGYQAYWSCDADNPASIRVARKLGFRQEKAYQELEYNIQ